MKPKFSPSGAQGTARPSFENAERLTPEQLRVRMKWSVRTLRRRTPLVGHIKDGRKVLFPLECVERYERERTVTV